MLLNQRFYFFVIDHTATFRKDVPLTPYAEAFLSMDSTAWAEAHIHAFDYMGGATSNHGVQKTLLE